MWAKPTGHAMAILLLIGAIMVCQRANWTHWTMSKIVVANRWVKVEVIYTYSRL